MPPNATRPQAPTGAPKRPQSAGRARPAKASRVVAAPLTARQPPTAGAPVPPTSPVVASSARPSTAPGNRGQQQQQRALSVPDAACEAAPLAKGKIMCICEMCTCGGHHCVAHPPQERIKFEGVTEFRAEYTKKQVPMINGLVLSGEFSGPAAGGNERPVKAAHAKPEAPAKPAPAWVPNPAKLETETEARRQFRARTPDPVTRVRIKDNVILEPGAFEGTTEAQAAFKGVPAPRVGQAAPRKVDPLFQGPFEGTTEARQQYIEKPMQSPSPRARAPWVPSDMPFEGTTEARAEFVKRPHVPNERVNRQPEGWAPAGRPFEGVTTQQADFIKHEPVRTQPLRARPATPMQQPFEGETEAQARFRAHPIMPVARKAPEHYMPNPNKFVGTTEAGQAFINPGTQARPERHLAPDNLVASGLPFDGRTTHQVDYPAKMVDRARPKERPEAPKLWQGKFEGVSENHAEFVPRQVKAPEKRATEPVRIAPEDRDFTTEGRELKWHPRHVCPASFLREPNRPMTPADGYHKQPHIVEFGREMVARDHATTDLSAELDFKFHDREGHEVYQYIGGEKPVFQRVKVRRHVPRAGSAPASRPNTAR